ncbi:hypothetical protein [Propioniciclava flava]
MATSAPNPPVAPISAPLEAIMVTVPSLYSVTVKPAFSPTLMKAIWTTLLYLSPV